MCSAPDREYDWTLELANLCKQYAPTSANKNGISPTAAWEGVDEVKIPTKLSKATFGCLVYVLMFEEERRKNDARTYAAVFLGIQMPHGGFVVRSLNNFKIYYVSSIHVHPFTFPYMVRMNKEPTWQPEASGQPMVPSSIFERRLAMGAGGAAPAEAPSAAHDYADGQPQLQNNTQQQQPNTSAERPKRDR